MNSQALQTDAFASQRPLSDAKASTASREGARGDSGWMAGVLRAVRKLAQTSIGLESAAARAARWANAAQGAAAARGLAFAGQGPGRAPAMAVRGVQRVLILGVDDLDLATHASDDLRRAADADLVWVPTVGVHRRVGRVEYFGIHATGRQ